MKDMTNVRFGRLLCIKIGPKNNGCYQWECICDCGNIKLSSGRDLRYGKINSCGCLKKESCSKNGKLRKTHGLSRTNKRLYDIWRQMLSRCYNKNNKDFFGYGNRGIRVFEEWKNIDKFFLWANNSGYQNNLTIERNDFNKDYCPDNCRWIPMSEQAHNTRRCKKITFNDKTLHISAWSRETGIAVHTIITRLRLGWSIEKTLTEPAILGRNQFSDTVKT